MVPSLDHHHKSKAMTEENNDTNKELLPLAHADFVSGTAFFTKPSLSRMPSDAEQSD